MKSVLERIEVAQGDITREQVDAIVNAANSSLLGGGGVDGAIHRGAGPRLLEACRKLNGCATGDAKITPGFDLPSKWVIHAVGPVWHGGNRGEDGQLASCYRRSLELAQERGARTIAFPLISTGVYRFPLERACRVALEQIKKFLEESDLPERVRLICFGEEAYTACSKALAEIKAAR